jgi:hypothetical protein
LYFEEGFGFQGAFNVSADEYHECTYTSLSTYDAEGMWNVFTTQANESITFFGLRGYWHFNWVRTYLIHQIYRVYKKKLNRFEIALNFAKQILVSSF